MRWPSNHNRNDGWRRRFAFLPVRIGDEVIWLEWIERRFMGEYNEVRLCPDTTNA